MLRTDVTLATMTDGYGLIPCAGVALEGDLIVWVGPMADLPAAFRKLPEFNAEGRLVTPGLIDCHGHPVVGGHRAVEFELRLKGASYEEVARAGEPAFPHFPARDGRDDRGAHGGAGQFLDLAHPDVSVP